LEIVQFLVEKGANFNCTDKKEWTPLAMACFHGHRDIVDYLLKQPGIDIRFCVPNTTCLILCVEQGSAECCELLLEFASKSGEDLVKIKQVGSKGGPSLLHLAAVHDNAEIIKLLFPYKPDLNARFEDQTPLHVAARIGNAKVIRALISAGSDIEVVDYAQKTPLAIALDQHKEEAAFALIENGARMKVEISTLPENMRRVVQDATVSRKVLGQMASQEILITGLLLRAIPEALQSEEFSHITTLDVSENSLERLDGLEFLINLKRLSASSNKLSSLSVVSKLEQLEELFAAENNLVEIPFDIGKCKKLKVVNLAGNKITGIPDSVSQLSNLMLLDLSKNQINGIPNEIGLIQNLKLYIIHNPLKELPLEDRYKEGKESVDEHSRKILARLKYRALTGEEACFRVKLMVVGQENVGKTSLLRCFREEKEKSKLKLGKKQKATHTTSVSVATDGIDIHDWIENVTLKDGTKVELTINAWDFAGQIVYYTTHQFFLSHRSIFLAVFNLTDPDMGRLAYWVKSIHSRIRDPIVILVGTHLDDKEATEATLAQASEKVKKICATFPKVKECVFLSTRTRDNVDALKGLIVREATKLPHVGAKNPKAYKVLEQKVMTTKKLYTPPVVSWEEFCRMGGQCDIEEQDMDVATAFLHDLGILVHFNDKHNEMLRKLVILDPQFLTKAMASIVSLKQTMIRDGIFFLKDCLHIWRPPMFPVELHETLLLILESFQVLYRIRDKGKLSSKKFSPSNHGEEEADEPEIVDLSTQDSSTSDSPMFKKNGILTDIADSEEKNASFRDGKPVRVYSNEKCIIPALLPEDRPPNFRSCWPRSNSKEINFIARQFQFGFLPLGFFSRLIVQLLHILPPLCYWQSGIVLQSPDHTSALIESYRGKKTIYIEVRGESRAKVLPILLVEIENLVKGWFMSEDLKATCYAVCPHCIVQRRVNPHLFSMSDCIDAVTSQKQYLYCTGYIPVRLRDLVIDVAMKDSQIIDYSELQMEKELGEGGFGKVYKCKYQGDPVAVKQLMMEGMSAAKRLQRFQDFSMEAFFMSQLKHDNIVQLVGLCMNPMCLVTEFVPCGDLYHMIKENDVEFVWPFVHRICVDVALGMRFLHGFLPPIIHRDLKSPNILMCTRGRLDVPVVAKVADFGLSSFSAASLQGGGDMFSGWQPPEVLNNQEYDESADVYSFGIIMWELVAFGAPFAEYDHMFKNIMMKRQEITKGLRPTIPEGTKEPFQDLMKKCWQTNPKERPDFSFVLMQLFNMSEGGDDRVRYYGQSQFLGSVKRPTQSNSNSRMSIHRGSSPVHPDSYSSPSLSSSSSCSSPRNLHVPSSSSSSSQSEESSALSSKTLTNLHSNIQNRMASWENDSLDKKVPRKRNFPVTQKKISIDAKFNSVTALLGVSSIEYSVQKGGKEKKKRGKVEEEEESGFFFGTPRVKVWCGCKDGSIIIYEGSGEMSRTLVSPHQQKIIALVELTPDENNIFSASPLRSGRKYGSVVCSVDQRGMVVVWNKESFSETARSKVSFPDHLPISVIACDSCIWIGVSRVLVIVQVNSPSTLQSKEIKIPHAETLTSMSLVPTMRSSSEFIEDGVEHVVWTGMSHGSVLVWDFFNFSIKAQSKIQDKVVTCLLPSLDGSVVLSANGQKICVWSSATFDLVDELDEHSSPVVSLVNALDFIVSVGEDGTVIFSDIFTFETISKFTLDEKGFNALCHTTYPLSTRQQLWCSFPSTTLKTVTYTNRQPSSHIFRSHTQTETTPTPSPNTSHSSPSNLNTNFSPSKSTSSSHHKNKKTRTKGGGGGSDVQKETKSSEQLLGRNLRSQVILGPKYSLGTIFVSENIGKFLGGFTGPEPGVLVGDPSTSSPPSLKFSSMTSAKDVGHLCFGAAESLFDRDLSKNIRAHDPISDVFIVEKWENKIFIGLADGGLWGSKARSGAQFVLKQLSDKLRSLSFSSVAAAVSRIEVEIMALEEVVRKHGHIVTMAFGLILKVESCEKYSKEIVPSYTCICCSIGNCKAYCYSRNSGHVTEITRLVATKQCLSAGVVGVKQDEDRKAVRSRTMDLQQMSSFVLDDVCIYTFACEKDDVLFFCSDGMHRNVDPEILRSLPAPLGLPKETWEDVYHDPLLVPMAEIMKRHFRETTIRDLIQGIQDEVTPRSLVQTLVEFCIDVTTDKRQVLEEISLMDWMKEEDMAKLKEFQRNMRKRVKETRGKLDHVCVVAALV